MTLTMTNLGTVLIRMFSPYSGTSIWTDDRCKTTVSTAIILTCIYIVTFLLNVIAASVITGNITFRPITTGVNNHITCSSLVTDPLGYFFCTLVGFLMLIVTIFLLLVVVVLLAGLKYVTIGAVNVLLVSYESSMKDITTTEHKDK